MDLPEPPSSADRPFAAAGRLLFWLGAGFATIAAPWLLGGEPPTAQWVLLAGSAVAFLGGLLVRLGSAPTPGARTAEKAQRWVLALGLLFVGYLFVQAANPSLELSFRNGAWMLLPLDGARPGPHSIRAPFESAPGDFLPCTNAWRFLLIYGTGWLFAAGLALGLRSRNDARRWVFLLCVNGLLVAVVSLVHRALGEKLTLWHYVSTVSFSGSPVFLYKNHNGCFLAAILAVILGVAATAENRFQRRVWEVAALIVWAATVSVNSRAAAGFATLWLCVYAGMRLRRSFREADGRRGRPWLFGALAAAGLAAVFFLANGTTVVRRFQPALSSPVGFLQGERFRGLLREVGLEMWRDDPAWGWGGGSFLYLFPNYESRVPELRADVYRSQPNLNRFLFPSADSDWVEFLVEYGLVGAGLLCAAAAVAAIAWWRWAGWRDGLTLFLLLGAAGIALHAYLDHILRNPALFLLLSGLLTAGLRLAAPRHHRRPCRDNDADRDAGAS